MAVALLPHNERVVTVERAHRVAVANNLPSAGLLEQIKHHRAQKMQEMTRFAELCDRFDNLYYPNDMTTGGADHWPDHVTAKTPGKVHISLNVYQNYVDIPASLQAVEPVENILPTTESPEGRNIAVQVERAYFAWKDEEDFELKAHQACVVKGLYGITAAKVYWDEDLDRPCVTVVDQPRNLWLGYARDNYRRLDWAMYTYRISLTEALAEYGLEADMIEIENENAQGPRIRLPFLRSSLREAVANPGPRTPARNWMHDDLYMIECVDYWYRAPKPGATIQVGKKTPMETRNAIFVGNELVKDMAHPEYNGKLPYVVLFNTYIPGVPQGRSEFYDIEPLIREKDERLSAGGQIIQKAIKGHYWQLRGQEAPDEVPAHVKPKEDEVIAPGPGNWVEKIEPFMPNFELETYLNRIDRELVDVSGLNDLLRGLAPATVISSSKAINALVANYEARIKMKRDLFYKWRGDIWNLTKDVWSAKNSDLKEVFKIAGRLVTTAPSITPRDDLETATMAANLMNAKIWAQTRAMDITGVDDPEAEQDLIRGERTDASMFPGDVQVQASLMLMIQQLQAQNAMAQQQAGASPAAAQQDQREQMGGAMGQPMMNGVGEQAALPPEGLPANAGGLPPAGPGENFMSQTQIQGGEAKNRLLLQQPIQPEEEGGGGY